MFSWTVFQTDVGVIGSTYGYWAIITGTDMPSERSYKPCFPREAVEWCAASSLARSPSVAQLIEAQWESERR